MMKCSFRSGARRGFTLLELLAVMVIIGIISSLVVGSLGVTHGNELTTGTNVVVEQLSLAHELAVSGNQPTEVWFLRKKGGTLLEAVQIYRIDEDGKFIASSKLESLPPSIGIDSGATLSPLFVPANARTWADPASQPSLPKYARDYDCWPVRFLSDGSTALSSDQQWYMTLHLISLGDHLSSLPANYAVVSISPANGKIGLYRP